MTMPPSGEQPAYVDPVTGQPLFIDPATGQLAYTDPTAPQPPAGYPPVSPYPTAPPTYPGFGAPNPYQPVDPAVSGVPATGYTTPTAAQMPGYGYPGYGYAMQPLQRRTSPMAITGMILSICGAPFLFCYGFGALLGLAGAIVSHIARRQIKQNNEDGGGMALAGIIIGWIDVAVGIVIVVLVVWFFASFSDNLDNVQ